MATQKKRLAITLDADQEQALYNLRKTDKYCRCSLAEIIRQLMAKQLQRESNNP